MAFQIEISQFMIKVKTNNGNKTKSDIFLWNMNKSDTYFFNKK